MRKPNFYPIKEDKELIQLHIIDFFTLLHDHSYKHDHFYDNYLKITILSLHRLTTGDHTIRIDLSV